MKHRGIRGRKSGRGPRVRPGRPLALLAACVVLLGASPARPLGAVADSHYVFGVFPFLSPIRIEQIFHPIVTRLSAHLVHEVRLESAATFEEFQQALEAERFDLAFVQPFDYVRIAAKKGYRPLVARAEPLSALLVVPEDSAVRTVEDLEGKVVALPPETAAVSYMVLSLLRDHGLVPGERVTIRYTRNHETCLTDMLVRDVATCGTAQGPLSVFEAQVHAGTRVLATSEPIPGSLVVAHPRLGIAQTDIARTELLAASPSPLSDAWSPAEGGHLFIPVEDTDYEPVRRIAARLGIL